MRPVFIALGLAAAVCLVALAWRSTRGGDASNGQRPERQWRPLARVVTVEVLNGGDRPGAARDAALRLRRARLDVVSWGNAPAALKDSLRSEVRVLVRRGDTTGAGRVAEVFGSMELVHAPDPRRLVDLTVVIPQPIREPE